LATQIYQRLDEPAATLGLRVLAVVGGVNINHHIRSLARPVDVLVATPGRAQDLINQGKLQLDAVRITTLDEADQMADMGFLPQVRKLLRLTPATGQRLLFSATLDGDVNKLVEQFLHDPIVHSTAPVQAAVDSMSHHLFFVGDRPARNEVALRIAARQGKTIMFMRTKHGVDRQVKKLRRAGINAYPLHGDKGQGARTRAIEGFSDGSVPVLVATDIAARGIDVDDVTHVINYQVPDDPMTFVHRIGRTGRAGRPGTAITLVGYDELTKWQAIAEELNINEVNPPKWFSTSPELAKALDIPSAADEFVGPKTSVIGSVAKGNKPFYSSRKK